MSQDLKKLLGEVIEMHRAELCKMADLIYDFAEKSAEEYKSMELLTDYLQKLYRRSDLSEQYVAEWLNQCKLLSIDASKKSTKKIKGKRYLCIPISSLNLGSL